MTPGYAADLTPHQAFDWWQRGEAVLVDVRSSAEQEWVGFVPGALAVPWKQWPGMLMNAQFDQALLAAVPLRHTDRSAFRADPVDPALVAAIAVLKNGLACLPVVMRMNAAEEMSGLLTGALLLLALTASVLPKILSRFRARHHAPAP